MSDPSQLSVRVDDSSEDPEVLRVAVGGELDFSNVPTLRRELRRAERRLPRVLVIDLKGLSFMDVAGLRTILDAARRAARDDRQLVVTNPIPPIMRLFELTAIDQSVDVRQGPFVPAA